MSHIFRWTPGPNTNQQPSPVGRGCRAPALSPAGARRVRGLVLSFVACELSSSAPPGSSVAVQINIIRHPGFPKEKGTRLLPRLPGCATRTMLRLKDRFGCAERGAGHAQGESIIGCDVLARQSVRAWERKEPLTRPARAGESAVAGHPLPKGEGYFEACTGLGWSFNGLVPPLHVAPTCCIHDTIGMLIC
jgi:hypothetical protein